MSVNEAANDKPLEREIFRIEREYRRREIQIDANRYAPWQPAESLILAERKMTAALMLQKAGKFPVPGSKCLEIGYGKLGWLADLISWGLRETDLHGIELDPQRAEKARAALPAADLRVGDATKLPWTNESFDLVVVSTVFSSILSARMRELIATEIERVLVPGGALIWYDLAVNNPKNPNVTAIGRSELRRSFPALTGHIRSVTLAPPIMRFVAPKSMLLAAFLNSLQLLRTHLLAVLVKR